MKNPSCFFWLKNTDSEKGKGRKTSIQMGTVKQLIESNTKELGKQVYQAPYNVITMGLITFSK
jgi:hypothetical protein